MQAAILEGLFSQPIQMATTCPSSNCTWTDITTLGICSTCDNVTDRVKAECSGPTTKTNGQAVCHYRFPSGGDLTAWVTHSGGAGDFTGTQWNATASAISPTSGTDGQMATFTKYNAVQLPALKSLTSLPPAVAWQCEINMCLKTYQHINTTNGVTTASIPAEQQLYTFYKEGRWNISREEFFAYLSTSPNFDPPQSSSNDPYSLPYAINDADLANLGAYMKEMFSSGWNDNGGTTRYDYGASSTFDNDQVVAPDVGRELAKTDSLPATMRQLTDSMSEGQYTTHDSGLKPYELIFVQQ